ncbi:unnamed protein product [Peniophora sp. CBMAI 1063]|nr:unnamed protein product [Peniophora sp. CBMAI 1063]
MSLRGRHILWGDSARGRIGNNNYITCPRLYDWANGRDVTPRLDGSVTCALTFLEGGRVISIVFAAGSYELWISDLESPDSEGRASVTHIFQFTFPAAWRVYVVPGASGTKVGLPTARLAQIVGNGRSCYFDHDDWVPFIVKFIMIDDHDVRPFTLRVPTSVFKKFTGRPREPEQLPVTIPYAAWSDGVVFEESEGLPFDSDTYRQAPHRIHGSRLYWWYYGDNALHVVDLHPRRLAWLTKDPNVRFRDTTFEVPNDARKPNAPDGPSCEMYFSVSGDCLVVQEHGHLDDADFDDERGPTYSIAVYSFV